jgi:hypothetical protein
MLGSAGRACRCSCALAAGIWLCWRCSCCRGCCCHRRLPVVAQPHPAEQQRRQRPRSPPQQKLLHGLLRQHGQQAGPGEGPRGRQGHGGCRVVHARPVAGHHDS